MITHAVVAGAQDGCIHICSRRDVTMGSTPLLKEKCIPTSTESQHFEYYILVC